MFRPLNVNVVNERNSDGQLGLSGSKAEGRDGRGVVATSRSRPQVVDHIVTGQPRSVVNCLEHYRCSGGRITGPCNSDYRVCTTFIFNVERLTELNSF